MKKIFTLILSLALVQAFGQTPAVVMQVVSSSGGYYATSDLSISWTLGEPVTSTLSGTNLILTQGFQQGDLFILKVSANTLNVAGSANSTVTFNITSNIPWTVSSNQTWLTPSSTSGSGNATITLTAAANPATSTRNATVTVSGAGVVPQTITVTQAIATNILEILNGNSVAVYPNPATNKVWLQVNNQNANGDFIVEVYDITGRKIINENLGVFNNQETKDLTVSYLKPGIYLVKVTIGAFNSDVVKLIKE